MKILRDEKGQVLVMVALSMTVLLGFVAFATDVGLMLRERRIMQTAADAAALAGAAESLYEGTPTSITPGMWTAATNDVGLNGFTAGANNGATSSTGATLTLNIYPNITVPGYNLRGYVQTVATQNAPTFFMKIFGFNSMNVTASAIASNTLHSDGCIYVQDGGNNDPNDTVDLNGHSLIAAPTCGMTVNGGISATGSSTINARFVTASGSITGGSAGSGWQAGVPAPSDPLWYLQETANQPTYDSTNKTCSVPTSWGFTGGCVFDYNGGNLNGPLANNTVYVFDSSATPVFAQNATITGNGVAIFLLNNDYIDFYNGTLNLSPSTWTTGATSCSDPANQNPLCGVLIDAPTDGSTGGTYTCSSGAGNNAANPGEIYFDFGSSTVMLTGIVYAPYMQLFVQDQGSATTFDTDLVIGNICAQSGPITVNGFSGDGSPVRRIGLVF